MHLRPAKISDVEIIYSLINHYAEENLMLARPRTLIYEYLRDFTVAESSGKIVGVGALHLLWDDLGEIRALAVEPSHLKQGIGRNLVNYFLEDAKKLGLPRVFALTYQPGFFVKCGFNEINKDTLPQKVWRECINCPKFPNCEEHAVIINL